MTCSDEIGVLVLAAGAASRFGAAKQLADIGGVAMVRHCAQNALRVTARVVVVTGAHREDVEGALHGLDLSIAHNDRWSAGMGGSIAVATRMAIERFPAITGVIVLLGDQPLVSNDDLRTLVDAHRADPERIIAAFAGGVLGPPCLFPQRYFEALTMLDGADGARRVLREHADRVVALDMPNAGVDVDTPQDYAAMVGSRTDE